jgi:outer membrane protein
MFLVRTTAAAFAALSLLAVPIAHAQNAPPAGTTFVYLNSAEILQAAPGSADAQRTFDRELGEWRQELEQQAAVVDSLVRDYQRQEVMLSPQAKEQKQTEIQTRQQELQNRRLELENQAQQRQQELLRPILERVTGLIEQIREESNYAMVFDISTEGVVAAAPELDITALVMQRMGTAAPATGGTP